jgi:hypothetical protein
MIVDKTELVQLRHLRIEVSLAGYCEPTSIPYCRVHLHRVFQPIPCSTPFRRNVDARLWKLGVQISPCGLSFQIKLPPRMTSHKPQKPQEDKYTSNRSHLSVIQNSFRPPPQSWPTHTIRGQMAFNPDTSILFSRTSDRSNSRLHRLLRTGYRCTEHERNMGPNLLIFRNSIWYGSAFSGPSCKRHSVVC